MSLAQQADSLRNFVDMVFPRAEFSTSSRAASCWVLLTASLFLTLVFQTEAQQKRFVPGRILVKPKQDLADYEFDTRIKKRGALQQEIFHRSNLRLLSVSDEQIDSVLASLREDPDLEFAERDPIAQACVIVNDPFILSGAEWHLERIEASKAWDITTGASNVTVAVLDSGVNFQHPDLQGRILPGYDFVNNNSHPMDDFGHGTAVAGTIVAGGNNGLGVAGTAFGCTVLPVKVMDQYGSASHSTIALGIEYAVQHGARVINLSLGGNSPSITLQSAIDYAWSNNVLIVAAAGNNASTVPQYPAACEHVLAVGASEPDDSRAAFSNYGSYVDLFAPGDNIWTTQKDLTNPYGSWRGTSFSSPIVAAVAALGFSLNPSLSNYQITDILKQTADPFQTAGLLVDVRRINALHAMTAIAPQVDVSSPAPQPPSTPIPVPPAVSEDTAPPIVTIVSGPSNGSRLASPVVNLTGTASDNAGIDHVEVQINEGANQVCNGSSTWNVQVQLTPGYNLLRVRAIDTAGNVSAEVTRAFTYVLIAPVVLQVKGMGAVAPAFTGTQLEVGKSYRIKAVSGAGQIFAGWSGSVRSNAAVLSFTMETNLVIIANFVPNPFLPVQGAYAGLMVNSNNITTDNSGYFAVIVTKSGAFTGKILTAGRRFCFSGKLNVSGDANVNVRRGLSPPLNLGFHLGLEQGSSSIVGRISSDKWISDLVADRNVFNALSNPAQQAGMHSLNLISQDSALSANGLSRISPGGSVRLHGKLNDYQSFNTSSSLARNGDCPFYLSRNAGAEMVIGWLNFPSGQSAANGTVLWLRTGQNAIASTLRAGQSAD